MIRILTDSASDILPAEAEQLGVTVIPLNVTLEDGSILRDGIDMTPTEYYAHLASCRKLPTTSQPSPELFEKFYLEAAAAGDEVLGIFLSHELSGTWQCAKLAADLANVDNVLFVDSTNVCLGEGLLVLEAARMRKAGASMDEVLAMLRNHRSRTQQVFTVDDLMHLQRGGRVSRVAAMVGSVLQIKPILESDELGRIIVTSKVRGRKKAIRYLADALRQKIDPNEKQLIGIAHADCKEDAETLEGLIRESCPNAQFLTVKYEPVTGAHVGPGALALFFLSKDRWR